MLVEAKLIPRRGRGLVTTRKIEAGEIVLAEEPLLLTVSQEAKDHACAHCMCWLEHCPGAVACQACKQVAFCSQQCQQQAAAKPWVHAEATCRAYAAIPALLPGDPEAQGSLRFLIQSAALKHSSAAAAAAGDGSQQQSGYGVLMSLVGDATPGSLAQAAVLQPALCKAVGDASCSVLSQAEAAALLVKEQLNSYGLLAPLGHQAPDGSRTLRGGGLYPTAALINHECLPNVARFDALDGPVEGVWPAQWPGRCSCVGVQVLQTPTNLLDQRQQQQAAACGVNGSSSSSSTLVVMRALHALPPGTEVLASYFPLNWNYQERQEQAQQVYGFTCACPRCLLESTPEWQADQDSSGDWETDDEGSGSEDEQAAAAAADAADDHHMEDAAGPRHAESARGPDGGGDQEQQQQQQQGGGGGDSEALDPTYLSLFMLKYMCPREGCYGTMAALAGSDGCECCVCGTLRSEAHFLAELEQ